MHQKPFPVIDMVETGKNIMRLREERGMTVRDLQAYFGFEEPQAIYKWREERACPLLTTCTLWELCWMCLWRISWYPQTQNRILSCLSSRKSPAAQIIFGPAALDTAGIGEHFNHFL